MKTDRFMQNIEVENIEGSTIVLAHKKILLPEENKSMIISSIVLPENKKIIIPENKIIGGNGYEWNYSSVRSH